jgi:hypothetical protein
VIVIPVATKVWAEDESVPVGVTNLKTCPGGPSGGWLRESPEYAAELYGLERGVGKYRVHVLDDSAIETVYDVEVVRDIRASVRRAPVAAVVRRDL